jgi:hypothetical protein
MSHLGETVRAKIDAGVLPSTRPEKIFAGHGQDEPCTVCGALIRRSQVEWSVRDNDAVTHRFHLGCYAPWEPELRRRGSISNDRDPELEAVVSELARYPAGLCLPCLADRTMIAPGVIAAAIARLGQTVPVVGTQGVCGTCRSERYLVRIWRDSRTARRASRRFETSRARRRCRDLFDEAVRAQRQG